jgi:hypothetical protein
VKWLNTSKYPSNFICGLERRLATEAHSSFFLQNIEMAEGAFPRHQRQQLLIVAWIWQQILPHDY